jgi:hypothetical protein
VLATVPPCSGEVAAGTRNGRIGKLLQMQGEVEEGSVGLAAGRNPELSAAASNGAGGRLGPWTAGARGARLVTPPLLRLGAHLAALSGE